MGKIIKHFVIGLEQLVIGVGKEISIFEIAQQAQINHHAISQQKLPKNFFF
jgi:hypothetical protein